MDLEFNFEKRYRLVHEIIETLVLTVLMFLIIRLAVQNFNIDGMSMEPNLHNQSTLLLPCVFIGASRRRRRSSTNTSKKRSKLVGSNRVVDRTKGSEENLWI